MGTDTSYVKEECALTLQYVPFQIGLIFHSSATIASFFATFYFLEKHIKNSPIHNNFKFLLFIYFFNSYVRGAVFVGSSVSFLYRVYIFNEIEQNFLMNSYLFQFFHLLFVLSSVIDTTIKGLLVFERTMATSKVEKYETEKWRKSCWMYLIVTIAFSLLITYFSYRTAEFKQSSCFAPFAPKNTEQWVNILYFATFIFSILSFMILRFLIHLNSKKLKIHNAQLTTRYQIRENLTCSHLVSSVLITGLLVTCFYGLCMIILRSAQFQIFIENRPLFSTVKLCCYALPIADLVIPIYSGSQLNRTKNARIEFLNNSVNTFQARHQTTAMYETILREQWA